MENNDEKTPTVFLGLFMGDPVRIETNDPMTAERAKKFFNKAFDNRLLNLDAFRSVIESGFGKKIKMIEMSTTDLETMIIFDDGTVGYLKDEDLIKLIKTK